MTDRTVPASDRPQDIAARVLRVVQDVLALDGNPPSLDCSITGDLAADSLDQVSLFMALEDEFGGSIGEEEAERLRTLRDVIEYIQGRATAAAAG